MELGGTRWQGSGGSMGELRWLEVGMELTAGLG
jgi:hypothetical protein